MLCAVPSFFVQPVNTNSTAKKAEKMIKNESDNSFLETELGERKEIDDDTQQSPKCGDDKHKAITLLKLHEDSLCNIFETVKKFRDEMRERREGISVVVDVDKIMEDMIKWHLEIYS